MSFDLNSVLLLECYFLGKLNLKIMFANKLIATAAAFLSEMGVVIM